MTDKQHILITATIIGWALFALALTVPIIAGEIVARRANRTAGKETP